MNGVGGDPLYAQLEEPEKPDTAHSGCRFGDNHFTTRQGSIRLSKGDSYAIQNVYTLCVYSKQEKEMKKQQTCILGKQVIHLAVCIP